MNFAVEWVFIVDMPIIQKPLRFLRLHVLSENNQAEQPTDTKALHRISVLKR